MSLLPILVLAAAAHKSRSRVHHTSTSSKRSGHTSYTHHKFHPEFDHYVLKEMSSGEAPELLEFMDKLFSYGEEIVQEHNDGVERQKQEELAAIREEFMKNLVSFKDAENRLQELHINLGRKIVERLSYHEADSYTVFKSFNGLDITDFIVSSDDDIINLNATDDNFRKKKEKIQADILKISELKLRRKELLVEIERLEQRVKLPFGRDNNNRRLLAAREELARVDESLAHIFSIIEQLEAYEQLSQEQKIAIIHYIEELHNINHLQYQYSSCYWNSSATYSSVHLTISGDDNVDVDLWFRALSRMFEKEDIDLAYIDTVFNQIEAAPAKWIDKDYEMHSYGPRDYSVEKYKQVLNFFLNYIFYPEYYDVLTRRVQYADIQEEATKVKIK